MSSSRIDEARARAQGVLTRAESDDEFKERLKADPEEALRAEGMPDDEIGDFVHQTGLAEVAGYQVRCQISCVITNSGVTKAL
jgi:hypothetical protein